MANVANIIFDVEMESYLMMTYLIIFKVAVVANITDDRAKWIFRDDTERTR